MENKILFENGRTIITNKKVSSMQTEIKKTNQNVLDEMQAVFDNVEKGYQSVHTQACPEQNCPNNQANFFGGQNQSMLASLLPLLKTMGGKNMGNLASIMSNLPSGSANNGNMLSQLLPLIQNLNSKKQSKKDEIKIDSFKRADE